MKTLLLSACLLFGGASEAAETKSDTIIINVGANKKVVVYGETKADLKDLEKIDLNKALKEMNKNLEEMPVKTRKMVVKDYDGSTFNLNTPQVDLTKWNRFVKKTNVSLHVAALNLGYYSIRPSELINSYKITEPFTAETFGGFNNSINLGVSVMHGQMYKLNKQLGFAFKKGLQYNFYRSEGSIPTPVNVGIYNYKPIFDLKPFTSLEPETINRIYADSKKNSLIVTRTYTDVEKTNIQGLAPKHTLGTLSIELQPTFYFLNKKGSSSFSISPGIFSGLRLHQMDRTTYILLGDDFEKISKAGRSSGGLNNQPFSIFNAGINMEVSYKIFHLFWRQNLYSALESTLVMTKDPLKEDFDYRRSGEGRIRMTTFGLRIGR